MARKRSRSWLHQQESLPNDLIIFEILTRLPVKTLVRFKSVSKHWHSLITYDQDFIKLHLQHVSDHNNTDQDNNDNNYNNDNVELNVLLKKEQKQVRRKKKLSDDTTCNIIVDDKLSRLHTFKVKSCSLDKAHNRCWLPPLTILNHDFNANVNKQKDPIGSANGLICFRNQQNNFSLWNPATRVERHIPGPRLSSRQYTALRWGFGYDSSSDDYKIVIIIVKYNGYGNSYLRPIVHIFTLRSNEWRQVEMKGWPYDHNSLLDRKYALRDDVPSIVVNENLHWCLGPKKGPCPVLAFNMAGEFFHVVPLPSCKHGSKLFMNFITKIGTSLCACWLFRRYRCDRDIYDLEVWELERYGDPKSWKKLFKLKDLGNHFMGSSQIYPNFFELRDGSGGILIFNRSFKDFLVVIPRGEPEEPPTPKQVKSGFESLYLSFEEGVCALSYVESLISPFSYSRASRRSGANRRTYHVIGGLRY